MIMVVLGNGFDLASGLPTSYNDFFKYRFKLLRDDFLKIDELSKPRTSFAKEHFTEYTNGIRRWAHTSNRYKEIVDNFENLLKQDVDVFHNDMKETAIILSETNMTFWDIYFYFKFKFDTNLNTQNWNRIETQIKQFLTSKDSMLTPNVDTNDPIKLLRFKVNSRDSYSESDLDNIIHSVASERIFQTFIHYFIKTRIKNQGVFDFYFSELQLFESAFSSYIKVIMSNTKKSNSRSQKLYRDNLIELVKNVKTDDIYILNFNYTFFESVSKNNLSVYTSKPFIIKREDRTFEIIENNVHGQYHNSTIFGVDQDNLKEVDHLYMFTKTYRKMRNQNDIPSIEIPKSNDLLEIVFYGHSLSDADYSYFQSIFDYYDIYRSSIKLVFKYSNYEENDLTGRIKTRYLDSVVKLIKFYGSKMMDNNHGNNLIHKLLLENRLIIEEVKLKKIDLSFQ